MAIGTAMSRGTGLLRTIALAWVLGVGVVSDAYNTANTAPNMIFALVAGGALSSALVPLLIRETDPAARAETASAILGAVVVVGLVATGVVVLCAPWIMRALTAGASSRPGYEDYLDLSSSWLRMFAPQILLYALSVFAVGVMTARRRLTLGATAPVATNLVTIVVALWFGALTVRAESGPDTVGGNARLLAGWGTTAAVAAMVGLQLWGAARCEPGLTMRFRPHHPSVRRLGRLGSWVVVYVLVNQVGLAFVIAIANRVAGGVTSYQWAFMVMQLPYAIVAVSLLSASLPAIAQRAVTGSDVSAEVSRPAQATLALLVPSAVGLALLAGPLAVIVVGPGDSELVAVALAGFAFSLVPFSIFQILTRTSYALGRTRTPAMVNVGVNVVNVVGVLAVAAMVTSASHIVAGLALSHALSYVVGGLVLASRLRSTGALRGRVFTRGLSRVVVAAAAVAAALITVPDTVLQVGSRAEAVVVTLGLGGAGAAIYFAMLRAMGLALAPPPAAVDPEGAR